MRVLVIRHGALGDFVQSFAPFAAIRAHHPGAAIVLLTTAPFATLAARAPWFDAVRIDARPGWWNLSGLLALRRQITGFDLVYDLQTSRRSSLYFRLAGRPAWSGIAPGASLIHAGPERVRLHTRERQRAQLAIAGIAAVKPPDLSWMDEAVAIPPRPYALLVPGAAPHRPAKRWPPDRFGALAARLAAAGVTPVVLGRAGEAALAAVIRTACPGALDLCGQTTLGQVVALARQARCAIGNDTGSMHLIAAAGCPELVLFSAESDPALTVPRGPDGEWPVVQRRATLDALGEAEVWAAVQPLLVGATLS